MTGHKEQDHAQQSAYGPYGDYIDRVWQGTETLLPHLTGTYSGSELVRLRDRVGFFPAFANVAAFDTGDGVVLVDSGDFRTAAQLHEAVSGFGAGPVRSVVYTHGHVDHVFGVAPSIRRPTRAAARVPR